MSADSDVRDDQVHVQQSNNLKIMKLNNLTHVISNDMFGSAHFTIGIEIDKSAKKKHS